MTLGWSLLISVFSQRMSRNFRLLTWVRPAKVMNGTLVSLHMTKKGLREKVNSDDHNLTRYQMIHNAHCMLLGLASERLLQVVTCSKVLASRPGFCDEGAWLKKYLVVKRTLCHPSELWGAKRIFLMVKMTNMKDSIFTCHHLSALGTASRQYTRDFK